MVTVANRISVKESILVFLSIAFAVIYPHFSFIPVSFGYIIPVFLVIWMVLRLSKENFYSIGFGFRRFNFGSILLGAVAAVILFLFLHFVFFPVLKELIPLKPANLDSFKSLRHNEGQYFFLLIASFIVGGIYEEIVFHGFIFSKIEKWINSRHAVWISVLITNLLFGIYHLQLGTSGMINAFVAGIAYHLFMIRFNRNLWYSIFFHTFFDWIALTYIYLGYW